MSMTAAAACHEMATAIMAWLVMSLLFGTALAGLTWLLVSLSGRMIPNELETLMWSLVLVKFLLPLGPVFSFSLRCPDEYFPERVAFQYQSPPHNADQTAAPSGSTDIWSDEGHACGEPVPDRAAAAAVSAALSQDTERPFRHGLTLAGMAYLVCASGLLGRRIWRHSRLLKRCRALFPADQDSLRLVRRACRRLGVKRIPAVRTSREAASSFVIGFLRPMLVLAHHQLDRRDELETVILHEVAHLRRSDMAVRYLQLVAGSLLFFWPVVAWVNRRIDLSRECACDEWALRRGTLTAGEYARCLVSAMQPVRSGCMESHSTCLASNIKNMERRIDMILRFHASSPKRKRWSISTAAVLLLSCAALGGAGESFSDVRTCDGNWPATEQAVKEHAVQVYDIVAGIDAADFDGDGVLTYVEKDSYLVALAMHSPQAFMEEFPYADRNHSGQLDYLEVYGVIRGITLVAYADRRPNAAAEKRLDLMFYHMALGAQRWLLDNVDYEPGFEDLDNIWSVIKRVEGPPRCDHHRKLDHGGPEPSGKRQKGARAGFSRFQELEANIEDVEARLAIEKDPQEAAKLRAMLQKLESILEVLEAD